MPGHYISAVSMRGDCLYCPLSLTIDSYWNCWIDCADCYQRRLNRTWGKDLRPAEPGAVFSKLKTGMERKTDPTTSLGWALKLKKTIRLGNKTDPYQPKENKLEVTRQIIIGLIELNWSFVIQTKMLRNLERDEDILHKAHARGLLTIMPEISCGEDYDWSELEHERTTPVQARYDLIERWIGKFRWNVGVNGEPYIPGHHNPRMFRDTLQHLKRIGVRSYNIYPIHFNDYTAKTLAEAGVDIEKVFWGIKDKNWRPVQRELCGIAEQEGVRLGCPDFVNTGRRWREMANTCCGIDVPNPSRFTTHKWKRLLQRGWSPEKILRKTWEGIGDRELGEKIIRGQECGMYTMKDAGLIK